jgi:hypothetical protein
MPWTAKDAEGHTKAANTPKKQKTWAKIANKARADCIKGGGDAKECDGRAIRIANAAVAKIKEGMTMRGYFTSGSATVEISALDVGGEKIPVSELVAVYQEKRGNLDAMDQDQELAQGAEETAAESESGFTEAVAGSLEDYAMSVKDAFRVAFKPVTVSSGVEVGPDLWPRDVFKDNSDLGDVVVVRGEEGQLYAVEYKETDEGFEFATRDNWRKVVLTYVPVETEAAEVGEAQLSESASGHAIALAETQAVTGGPRAPLLMDVVLISPGWGNKKDNHYYSPEVLARDARVFEGAKMYTTDHRQGDKSVRTEVSVVKKIKGFTDDGAPIASVAVHDPDFAEATRNRKKLGTLETLECSILGAGRTKKGKVGDRKGNIVEAIISGTAVDWVTKAGRGGHAIALAENSTGGDNNMSEEEQVITQEQEQEEETQEATLSEGQQQEVTYLAESEVKAALEASRLPQQAIGRLAEGQYLDTEALKTTIEAERAYIKELTGSGRPFAQGDTAPVDATMSEADYDAEYDDIMKRHSVYVPQKEA